MAFIPVVVAMLLFALTEAAGSGATLVIQRSASALVHHGELADVSCTSGSSCTAVGYSFNPDSGSLLPLVEHWNGAAWSVAMPSATGARHGQLLGVSCTSPTACTAVGELDTNSGDTLPLAERWNGVRWSVQGVKRPFAYGSPDDATLYSVSCVSNRACLAVGADGLGAPLAELWNGSRWSIKRVPSPNIDGGALLDIACTSRGACTAVGTYLDANTGCSVPLVEEWNGRRWALQHSAVLPRCGVPNDSTFTSVSCTAATTCTATGFYDHAGGAYDFPLVERRHGGSWSIQPTPPVKLRVDPWDGGGDLNDLSCTSATTCIAVGDIGSAVKDVPMIERWTGGHWKLVIAWDAGRGALFGVSCTSQTTCTAVGSSQSGGPGSQRPLVERLSSQRILTPAA